MDAIQSTEVIEGAPPPEYGDKDGVIIVVTTRSGLGANGPHGDINASYGSFGTTNAGFDFLDGSQNWGYFISVNGMDTGRFLDWPEFAVMHDRGNEQSLSAVFSTDWATTLPTRFRPTASTSPINIGNGFLVIVGNGIYDLR